ncbi:sensor histidine kinase [Spartinivicinus poritis]|uniref:Sensor histidine kinase n=1 Tax=Spartinivicinus poritis TaxID=2994640 RepID=A0ABT5U7P0_9GAMM|nr:sensor histidine kinase [Spartinivicinus sp. A2-2]MDE1461428.1 sensor histidine kinase [Spartinivicinus sp. A2-2]
MKPFEAGDWLDQEFFLPDLCTTRAVFMLVVLAELFVLILVLALPSSMGFDWNHLALTSFFVQWVVLVSAGCLCRIRPLILGAQLGHALAACYSVVLLVTLVFSLAAEWVIYPLDWDSFWLQLDTWHISKNLLVALIITSLLLRYFYVQQQLRKQEQAELRSRLQALQARIHPHFLFNSMNSIASLIQVSPEKAEQAVEDLAALFRACLDEVAAKVTLADELEICKQYLRIEKHRLGERLQVNWNLEEVPDSLPIPPLTLQPLLENAVYHGIQPLAEGGTISIEGQYDNQQLTISIHNPVDAAYIAEPKSGNQMAIQNIAARLQALYGKQASLSVQQKEAGFVTQLSYPCSTSDQADI